MNLSKGNLKMLARIDERQRQLFEDGWIELRDDPVGVAPYLKPAAGRAVRKGLLQSHGERFSVTVAGRRAIATDLRGDDR